MKVVSRNCLGAYFDFTRNMKIVDYI